MKVIILTGAAAYCVALSLLSNVQGSQAKTAPQDCGIAGGALSESSDRNIRVTISCNSSEASATAMFTANQPPNSDIDVSYDVFIRFSCYNGTHSEVYPTSGFRILQLIGDTDRWETELSGNVECMIFGCYEAAEINLINFYESSSQHNFASANSSVEGTVCSINHYVNISPSVTQQPLTSSYVINGTTLLERPSSTTLLERLSSTTLLEGPLLEGPSSTTLLEETSSTTLMEGPLLEGPSSTTLLEGPSSTTAVTVTISTGRFIEAHPHAWQLLLVVPVLILMILSCIVLMFCTVIAKKRWRKHKQLRNLRTGYGLQKNDHQSKELYQHIADTLLDIVFSEPREKYVSTNSIIDLFNFTTVELGSNEDMDSRIESEILHTLTRTMKHSSSESDVFMSGHIDLPSPPYIPSLVYEFVTPCNTDSTAVTSHTGSTTEHTANTLTDYVEALVYTANQVVNDENENASSSFDDSEYVKMSDLVPATQLQYGSPNYEYNNQGYVQL